MSSFQKPWKPPRYATSPNFANEICSGSFFFYLWEVVQIFQTESIFCSKISSRGSLFIEKLVPGGTNFGGSIFTITGACFPGVLVLSRDSPNLVNGIHSLSLC